MHLPQQNTSTFGTNLGHMPAEEASGHVVESNSLAEEAFGHVVESKSPAEAASGHVLGGADAESEMPAEEACERSL